MTGPNLQRSLTPRPEKSWKLTPTIVTSVVSLINAAVGEKERITGEPESNGQRKRSEQTVEVGGGESLMVR